MNSIEDLRDYLIADTIENVQSMSREELVSTLITIRTNTLERMTADELMEFRKHEVWKTP